MKKKITAKQLVRKVIVITNNSQNFSEMRALQQPELVHRDLRWYRGDDCLKHMLQARRGNVGKQSLRYPTPEGIREGVALQARNQLRQEGIYDNTPSLLSVDRMHVYLSRMVLCMVCVTQILYRMTKFLALKRMMLDVLYTFVSQESCFSQQSGWKH